MVNLMKKIAKIVAKLMANLRTITGHVKLIMEHIVGKFDDAVEKL